jgi:RHS repeat-associated protein
MVYDYAGNLTNFDYDDGSEPVSITNSFTGDLLTARGSDSVNWDENGWQTSQLSSVPNDYFLEYDRDGRLRKAQAGVVTKYMTAKYTPDGVRITRTRSFGDADDYDHKYIVDVSGRLPKILLILDASTSDILKTFIHADNQVIAQHDGRGFPVGEDPADPRYFYMHDRLGSVRQVFDPVDLSVKNNYVYDAWGLIIEGETTEGDIWNPYRFAGYLWDSEISMYYCNARMYDPVLGRFTSRDPVFGELREPLTLHAYLYCLNDPIDRSDPSGEFAGFLAGLPTRAKDMAVSMGAKMWAKAKIEGGATLANALKSGYMNQWFGPEFASDRAKFWTGFSAGFMEAQLWFRTENASLACGFAGLYTSSLNEYFSGEPFTSKSFVHIAIATTAGIVQGPLGKWAEPFDEYSIVMISFIRELGTGIVTSALDLVVPGW